MLSDFLSYQQRLLSVQYPLVTTNTDLCFADVAPAFGLALLSESDFLGPWQAAARAELGVDESLLVVHVVPGSVADEAGLATGDRLIAIDGKPFAGDASGIETVGDLSAKLLPNAPYEITYRREGIEQVTHLTPALGCRYRFVAIHGEQLELFASGDMLLITEGTLKLLPVDDELAAILAIEMIRDARSYDTRRRINSAGVYVGEVALAIFLGINTNGALSQITADESAANYAEEADHLALYMLARAGFDYRQVPVALERIADDPTGAVSASYLQTHPLTLDRYEAVDAAVRNLEQREANGERLVPEPELMDNFGAAGNEDREAIGSY